MRQFYIKNSEQKFHERFSLYSKTKQSKRRFAMSKYVPILIDNKWKIKLHEGNKNPLLHIKSNRDKGVLTFQIPENSRELFNLKIG